MATRPGTGCEPRVLSLDSERLPCLARNHPPSGTSVKTGELIILESCLHNLSGNRRASASLSPVRVHFVAPQDKLYQRLLTLEPLFERIPPIAPPRQRQASRQRKDGFGSCTQCVKSIAASTCLPAIWLFRTTSIAERRARRSDRCGRFCERNGMGARR